MGLGIKTKILGTNIGNWVHCYYSMKKNGHKRTRKGKPIYFIIGFDDPQKSGWTVWERVVLYNCIYAKDHGMIPVVDMKNYRSIYSEKNDCRKVNVWDQFYLQPGGVSLEQAMESGNYLIADSSPEWFSYIRARYPKRIKNMDYLRTAYSEYIKLRPDVETELHNRLMQLTSGNENARILTLCIRGTDYKKFAYMKQPPVETLLSLGEKVFADYKCDYYYLATEDLAYVEQFKASLPENKVIVYDSGIIKNYKDGFIGEIIGGSVGEYKASMDYLTVLYIMNKSVALIGGLCGATIVAEYKRNPEYEYINIIDMHEHY